MVVNGAGRAGRSSRGRAGVIPEGLRIWSAVRGPKAGESSPPRSHCPLTCALSGGCPRTARTLGTCTFTCPSTHNIISQVACVTSRQTRNVMGASACVSRREGPVSAGCQGGLPRRWHQRGLQGAGQATSTRGSQQGHSRCRGPEEATGVAFKRTEKAVWRVDGMGSGWWWGPRRPPSRPGFILSSVGNTQEFKQRSDII